MAISMKYFKSVAEVVFTLSVVDKPYTHKLFMNENKGILYMLLILRTTTQKRITKTSSNIYYKFNTKNA